MFSLFGRFICHQTLALVDLLATSYLNIFAVFRHGRRPTFAVFLRQIYLHRHRGAEGHLLGAAPPR